MSVWYPREDFDALAIQKGHREVALDDAWEQFRDYDGPATVFFEETRTTHPHRWLSSTPEDDDNPIYFSIDAQAAYAREHGAEATRIMLAEAGLKIGQVRKAAPRDHSKDNPYAPAKPGQEAARTAKIVALVRSSATLAASLAKSAGCRIDGSLIPKK